MLLELVAILVRLLVKAGFLDRQLSERLNLVQSPY